MIAVIIPTRFEAAMFLRKLKDRLFFDANQIPQWQGRLGTEEIRVVLSGIGAWAAHAAAQEILKEHPRCLIGAGFAGALDDRLKTGCVLVDQKSTAPEYQKFFQKLGLERRIPLAIGPLATTDRVLSTPNQKKEFAQSSGALAVDMENAVISAQAFESKVPYLGVRVIFDNLQDDFSWLLQEGRVMKTRQLLKVVLKEPKRSTSLVSLASKSFWASRRLAQVLKLFIKTL